VASRRVLAPDRSRSPGTARPAVRDDRQLRQRLAQPLQGFGAYTSQVTWHRVSTGRPSTG
jgi:hypothetical protein